MRFCRKKKHYKNEKHMLLFITKNTHFDIYEKCWVPPSSWVILFPSFFIIHFYLFCSVWWMLNAEILFVLILDGDEMRMYLCLWLNVYLFFLRLLLLFFTLSVTIFWQPLLTKEIITLANYLKKYPIFLKFKIIQKI